jgi:hypothetical protein
VRREVFQSSRHDEHDELSVAFRARRNRRTQSVETDPGAFFDDGASEQELSDQALDEGVELGVGLRRDRHFGTRPVCHVQTVDRWLPEEHVEGRISGYPLQD